MASAHAARRTLEQRNESHHQTSVGGDARRPRPALWGGSRVAGTAGRNACSAASRRGCSSRSRHASGCAGAGLVRLRGWPERWPRGWRSRSVRNCLPLGFAPRFRPSTGPPTAWEGYGGQDRHEPGRQRQPPPSVADQRPLGAVHPQRRLHQYRRGRRVDLLSTRHDPLAGVQRFPLPGWTEPGTGYMRSVS